MKNEPFSEINSNFNLTQQKINKNTKKKVSSLFVGFTVKKKGKKKSFLELLNKTFHPSAELK